MENEALIRLSIFLGLFALFAALEALTPRRVRSQPRGRRWITNWAFTLCNTLILRALAIGLPLLAVGAAMDAQTQGWGLFNQVDWPVALEFAIAILILDFAIWAQHLITHKVPILWRLHRVHHADRDIDVSTAIRFHPVEIALSMGLKIGLVYALGPAALAVIVFEILLNGTAMFNHANIKLPLGLDRALRLVLVTPDMHRVHHSVSRHEHDSNYGFALSIWDRIFGTYIAQPHDGHEGMQIGLEWQDGPARAAGMEPMATLREEIVAACAPLGLSLMGVVPDEGRWIALVGLRQEGWEIFTKSAEYRDGVPDPMDRWSQRVMPTLSQALGATEVVYPFGGPPYAPFISWAFASGETFQSPVGMLVHAEAGFWISFRGALIFDREIAGQGRQNPCAPCPAPCSTACPVGALAPGQDYDVPTCKAHIASEAGRDCREGGCLVRRACPVSERFGRDPEQSAFHMRAFTRA